MSRVQVFQESRSSAQDFAVEGIAELFFREIIFSAHVDVTL